MSCPFPVSIRGLDAIQSAIYQHANANEDGRAEYVNDCDGYDIHGPLPFRIVAPTRIPGMVNPYHMASANVHNFLSFRFNGLSDYFRAIVRVSARVVSLIASARWARMSA